VDEPPPPATNIRSATSVVCGDEKDWWDRRREQDLHDHWKVPPYWGW
jgi:hypothetical protein